MSEAFAFPSTQEAEEGRPAPRHATGLAAVDIGAVVPHASS